MCQTHKKQNFHGWGIDTISIVATSPRFGTIAKNHIQSSKVITRLLFFCSEYVTSLKNYINHIYLPSFPKTRPLTRAFLADSSVRMDPRIIR